MSSTTNDLSTISGLQSYLSGTPFESTKIVLLEGGYSNFTFRVTLKTPIDGNPDPNLKYSTVVVKHARPFVIASGAQIAFDSSRQVGLGCVREDHAIIFSQIFEVEALRRVKEIIPESSIVAVPIVYRLDVEAGIIIIEDCGEDALNLKKFTQQGGLSVALAAEIGKALGEFIGQLHIWGRGSSVIEFFEDNQQAKRISAWATYGRLMSTLSGEDKLAALEDPPIDIAKRDLDIITRLCQEKVKVVTTAQDNVTNLQAPWWIIAH